jgi:hypothetical protein
MAVKPSATKPSKVRKQSDDTPSVIDPKVIKFLIALAISAIVIELVDSISKEGAWTLTGIVILGLLLNNPAAISLITLGSQSLTDSLES